LLLIHDLHTRVVTPDGRFLRELQLDPTNDYQQCPETSFRFTPLVTAVSLSALDGIKRGRQCYLPEKPGGT